MATKLILASLLFCTLSPAYAEPPSTLYNWSGIYVGAHLGWEQGEIGGTTQTAAFNSNNLIYDQNVRGALGGGQLGFNLQYHRVVLGLELSGSFGNSKSYTVTNVPATTVPFVGGCLKGATPGSAFTFACAAKQEWTTEMLAKVGYALGDGRLLPYVAGGVSLKTLSTDNTGAPSGSNIIYSQWGASNKAMIGLTFGGGAQYLVTPDLFVGAEYRVGEYGNQDFSSFGLKNASIPFAFLETHNLATQTVRLSVNYKLGERSP